VDSRSTAAVHRVLVTGHEGYIGSVMTPALLDAGYDVIGVDSGFFTECSLVPPSAQVPTMRKDIRDLEVEDLEDFDAVVHLAALSNDPIGNLNAGWTRSINLDASVRLAELARRAGVSRFLFSSSCIMYGVAEEGDVDEDSVLDPQTEYARSKVDAEQGIRDLAGSEFSPTFLRNGTVYGVSSRMRFDTVLNNFVGSALAYGRVAVRSDGKPWRPVVHVQDVARAFVAVLSAPRAQIHNEAFNVGADQLNVTVGELAELAAEGVGGCTVDVLGEPEADQRTYRTNFAKFTGEFPTCEFRAPGEGAPQLAEGLAAAGVARSAFEDERFTRLAWLRHLLSSGRLDDDLRWSSSSEALQRSAIA
jgi:nucleoside-diphosphate-sugar epimerase